MKYKSIIDSTHYFRKKAQNYSMDILCTIIRCPRYEFIIQSLYSKYLLLLLLLTVLQVDAHIRFGYLVTNL